MPGKSLLFNFILILSGTILHSQSNSLQTGPYTNHMAGTAFFDHNLYGPASHTMGTFLSQPWMAIENRSETYTHEAGSIMAISNLRLGLTSGENDLIRFIAAHYPDPSSTPAILELGSYYYNQRAYDKAITYYSMVNTDDLPEYDRSEAAFKKGYAHFVTKGFKEAKNEFDKTRDIKNDYYHPSNYYYGLCDYFMGSYAGAVNAFEKVRYSDQYKSFVPYYLTQIYLAQKQYPKVISSGEESLKDTDLRNRTEIRQIIGQAYFALNEYEKALPHLEYYESKTAKLTVEEFFQLGFTQYQLKKYPSAIRNFLELNLLDNKLGQQVNYYLADCYYKTGDKVSARTAFRKVSQMDWLPVIRDEAMFNYAKLSAESGYDREAISTLLRTDASSKYHAESLVILNDLLAATSDYAFAMNTIEGMKNPNDKLKLTHQKAGLNLALLSIRNNNKEEAISHLDQSTRLGSDRVLSARAKYWKGWLLHDKGDYRNSVKTMDEFLSLANGLEGLPTESSHIMGHYTQGYNYLAMDDYKNAEKSFKNVLTGFNIKDTKIQDPQLMSKVWPDAMVRTGDCLFKSRNYKDALSYYNQAIARKQGAVPYALYQKGIIEGLTGEPYEKILTMQEVKAYGSSEYTDDALFQLGDTYQSLDNSDNAYASFTELVAKHPASPLKNASLIRLALIAYNKGDMTTAITHYKAIFQNKPSAKEAESALLGLQEIYINDLGKSEEYVEFASSLPGYKIKESAADSLAYMVGAIRYNEGDYEKAVSGFNNYLTKYPNGLNMANAHYFRGESYTLLKKYDQALADYEKLITLKSSQYYAACLRKAAVISYNHTQDFAKAYRYYDLNYSTAGDEDEKYKAALGALRSAFRLADGQGVKKYAPLVTENKKATNEEKATAWYYLAKNHYKQNEWVQATTAFEKTAQLSDNNQAAESRYLLAEIQYKQNNTQKAEDLCNKANELNAAYPYWIARSLLLLSDIYTDRKDLFNARAALEAILENFPDDKDLKEEASAKLKKVEELEKSGSRIKSTGNQLELINRNGQ